MYAQTVAQEFSALPLSRSSTQALVDHLQNSELHLCKVAVCVFAKESASLLIVALGAPSDVHERMLSAALSEHGIELHDGLNDSRVSSKGGGTVKLGTTGRIMILDRSSTLGGEVPTRLISAVTQVISSAMTGK